MSAWLTTKNSKGGRLLFFSLYISAVAHSFGAFSESYTQADRELNATYQQALLSLPIGSQEILRRAGRTWIDFTNKSGALLNALLRDQLISSEAANDIVLSEMRSRRDHLQIFFLGNQLPFSQPMSELRAQDERLNEAYQNCLARLNNSERLLLRDAQRAWIAYRDADAKAVQLVPHKPPNSADWVASAEARASGIRTAQLIALDTRNDTTSRPAETPQQISPTPSPVETPQETPPPFDDARQVEEWQEEAKQSLLELTAKKDCDFFEEVKSMKAAPLLPKDISEKITSALLSLKKLRSDENNHGISPYSEALRPTSDEASTITLLDAWPEFVAKIKNAEIDVAGAILSGALENKPSPLPSDYAPIWQKIGEWKDAYDTISAKFRDHLRNAQNFLNLGKTSEAIREYQSAYELIEDPKIPPEIKRIRDQTLGL